jgi:hypothetical protein
MELTSEFSKKLIELLKDKIESFVFWGSIEQILFESIDITDFDEKECLVEISLTYICILDDDPSLPQCSSIKENLSLEAISSKCQWKDLESLQSLSEPINIETDEPSIETLEWGSPEVNDEIINRYNVDEIGVVEELEEYYGSLDNINYDDFPKSLIPMIKRCVEHYEKIRR